MNAPKQIATTLPGVVILEPRVFGDSRGYFFESYNAEAFAAATQGTRFIQDNESLSGYSVLRGLHYQLPPYAQAKLVRVIQGRAWDVAVDIRRQSPTFGQWTGVEISAENKRQLFIPQGYAHGFVVLSQQCIFTYKVDQPYAPDYEAGIQFNDAQLAINWPLTASEVQLSAKDKQLPPLAQAQLFP